MDLTFHRIEHIMTKGHIVMGVMDFSINGKRLKNTVFSHDMSSGLAIIRQNAVIDGFDIEAISDTYFVDEYCYVCEKLGDALKIKTRAFQDYVGVKDVSFFIPQGDEEDDSETVRGVVECKVTVDGEEYSMVPVPFSLTYSDEGVVFLIDGDICQFSKDLATPLKQFRFTSKERLKELVEIELLDIINKDGLYYQEFKDEDSKCIVISQ